jgi:hypothetical protein
MNWTRTAFDLLTLDGHEVYIVRHTLAKKGNPAYYNAWEGDHKQRDRRTYISAGDKLEDVKAACERLVQNWDKRASA